jgi:hypothetical protein
MSPVDSFRFIDTITTRIIKSWISREPRRWSAARASRRAPDPPSTCRPSVVAIEYPPGRPFGEVGDANGQRDVLHQTLELLEEMEAPGVRELPHRWPEARPRWHPPALAPIARLLARKPWLLPRFYTRNIPEHSSR